MEYRREVDGLRALAVVPVIFFHAGFEIFSGGFVGVDIFFVISGFLITSILIDEGKSGDFSVVRFYERRARRILPALFLVLFACLPAAWLILLPSDFIEFSQSITAVSIFTSNIFFWRQSGYFDTSVDLKPLLHTWSLAVEEQYYLFFPIFLMVGWRHFNRWITPMLIAVAVLSLIAAQWGALNKPEATFYLLPTRVWELLIGALIAFYLSDYKAQNLDFNKKNNLIIQLLSLMGLLLILGAVVLFDKQTPFPGINALFPTLGAALIILFASKDTFVGKFLGSKVAVGIGLISYSLYLWHQPIFAFSRHISIKEPKDFVFLILICITFLLSYLTWRYVEAPFRSRQWISRERVFILAGGFTLVFILIGLVGFYNDGFKNRYPQTIVNIDTNAKPPGSCSIASKRPFGACQAGEGKLVGAVVGDSHAAALFEEMSKSLSHTDKAVWFFKSGGCPLIPGLKRIGDPSCAQKASQIFPYISSSNNFKYVILSARWTLYTEGTGFNNGEGGIENELPSILETTDELSATVKSADNKRIAISNKFKQLVIEYLKAGKVVIVVYPVPEAGWDVPRAMMHEYFKSGQDFDPHFLSTSSELFRERNKAAIQALDSIGEYENLIRIKPEKLFCDSFINQRCITQINGIPLYYDNNHLSDAGARILVKEIMNYIH